MKVIRVAVWIVAVLGVMLAIASMYPPIRHRIQNAFNPGYSREILATVDGDLMNNGSNVKVIKYKGPDSIFLEIVENDNSPSPKLLARIVLPDKRDGMFNLHGRVTSLAIADIDNDGMNELLAATFDDQLVPHLNIYRYSPSTQRFEAVKPPQ